MARIALISPYNYPSLPVRLLHSVLKEKGHEPVSIFFKRHRLDKMGPPSDEEYRLLHKTITDVDPLYVGFSFRSTYATVGKRIAEKLNKDGRTIVWGGTHATVAPEDCIDHADAVCVGEGEGALLDITDRLVAGETDLSGIPNIWSRSNGEVVKAEQRPLIQDLDALPMAWYENKECLYIENDEITDSLPEGYMTSYDLMTSRGCPYRCEFCCHSLLINTFRGLGRYIRRRTPESVVSELEQALERFPTVSRIRFWDDVFPAVKKQWLVEFAELYKERVGLPFWCYTTSEVGTPEVLSLLKSAGLRYLGMGIQSGSSRVRREVFGRAETTKSILTAARNFKDHDVHPEYDLICDNPFETAADFEEAFELMMSIPASFSLYQHSLTYFPNFPITKKALDAGYIVPEDVEHVSGKSYKQWHDEFASNRSPEHTYWITLFYLTQFKVVPRALIRALSRSTFFRRRPVLLNRLVKPFGRLAEKARWAGLYLKERDASKSAGRLLRKVYLLIRGGLSGSRTSLSGAD